ncbi:MAG: hypothetical protein WD646_13465 [Actinomycetota bacterium]
MSVRRFSDPDEARRALFASSDDAALARRISSLWARATRLAPPSFDRGVKKFRSIDAANRDRDRATAQRVRRLRRKSS